MLPPSADGRGVALTSDPYTNEAGEQLWDSDLKDSLVIGTRTVDGQQVQGWNEEVDLRKPCRAIKKACVENPDTPKTEAECLKEESYVRCVKVDCLEQDSADEVERTKRQVSFVTTKRVEAGDHWITFGGVRNPLSTTPTTVFRMLTRNEKGQCIGANQLDNIAMEKMLTFDDVEITQSNERNGEQSVYTVKFTATAPIADGDLFTLVVPKAIRTPADPLCSPVSCLAANAKDAKGKETLLACTSERGRIVLTLAPKKAIVDGKTVVDAACGQGGKFAF
jgi:hypothetical protein